MGELLTVQEVAKILKVSPGWVRDHTTRSEPLIPCVRLGSKKRAERRFRPEDVQAFILLHLSTQGKAV